MLDRNSVRDQILALPTSAGADVRDMVDRQAVLDILDAASPACAPAADGEASKMEREACATLCDERARLYRRKAETGAMGDRERMKHAAKAMETAAFVIRSRSRKQSTKLSMRVLFGRELNGDGPRTVT